MLLLSGVHKICVLADDCDDSEYVGDGTTLVWRDMEGGDCGAAVPLLMLSLTG